jgi:hypothetical protein
MNHPTSIPRRQVGEWSFTTTKAFNNPFIDVSLDVVFSGPGGRSQRVPAFYDGDRTWRVRFNPDVAGAWSYQTHSCPVTADLERNGTFEVTPCPARGFWKSTPGKGWGFSTESGEAIFVLGDTVYNIFGAAHCGYDVESFLARRAEQGFNLLRARLPVSPYHPPEGYSAWQTRRTWPWGGSEQAPRFDQFNLDYFRTVDRVVQRAEAVGIGLEMIMEAWGFEFPFNSRAIFTPEWEELWMRYLIARYDAYNAVAIWTLMNEYEFYPNGDWNYKPVADRWAMRVARWVKALAQHGHVVAVHNGPRLPTFANRFAADPGAVDAILFQDWGDAGREGGWLASGIENAIGMAFKDWWGSAIFAEWGYERNPDLELLVPGHIYCDPEHTRRGAWRGAMCGLGVIHGFENTWGPFSIWDQDQPGLVYLLHLRRFFSEVVLFETLRPAPDLVLPADWATGMRPLALADAEKSLGVVYLPVGGEVSLALPEGDHQAEWFDPRTGLSVVADAVRPGCYVAPTGADPEGHPWDAALVVRKI